MTNQGGIMLSMQLVLVILYASMTVYSPNQKLILRTDYSCKYIFYFQKKNKIFQERWIIKKSSLTRLKLFEKPFLTYNVR